MSCWVAGCPTLRGFRRVGIPLSLNFSDSVLPRARADCGGHAEQQSQPAACHQAHKRLRNHVRREIGVAAKSNQGASGLDAEIGRAKLLLNRSPRAHDQPRRDCLPQCIPRSRQDRRMLRMEDKFAHERERRASLFSRSSANASSPSRGFNRPLLRSS